MSTSFVTIVPNAATNALVNIYAKKPEFGYLQLSSEEMSMSGGWMRTSKRSTLLRAKVQQLNDFLANFAKNGQLPGKIIVREFLEDSVPAQYLAQIDKNRPVEEAIAQYIKRAGEDGPVLMKDGQRILRFTEYVMHPTADHFDITVQHDNTEAVATHRAKEKARQAQLPPSTFEQDGPKQAASVPAGVEPNDAPPF